MKVRDEIERSDSSYGAYVPDLPGCVAVAESEAAVRRLIREAVELHLSELEADGEPRPPPSSRVEYVSVSAAA